MKVQIGEIVNGHYKIEALLGQGGFGAVYRALDQSLNRIVALKILKSETAADREDFQRFLLESKNLAKLAHPNIVSVYAVELLSNAYPMIVMEYLSGKSLKQLIDEAEIGLDALVCRDIFAQICAALSTAHKAGLVHRDISATNIIVNNDHNSYIAKLIDFGLSKQALNANNSDASMTSRGLTRTGTLVGNPSYMSPEACRGEPCDEKSDIYSAGCLLYQMLSGRLPFQSDEPIGLLFKHQSEMPRKPTVTRKSADKTQLLCDICLLCLQKAKDKRPQSFAQLLEILESNTLPQSLQKPTNMWTESVKQTNQKQRYYALLAMSLILITVVFTVVLVKKQKDKASQTAVLATDGSRRHLTQNRALTRVAQKRQLYGADNPALLPTLWDVTASLLDSQSYEAAKPCALEMKTLMEKHHIFPKTPRDQYLTILHFLMDDERYHGSPDKAVEYALTALNYAEKNYGHESETYVLWLSYLASVFEEKHDDKNAEKYFRESATRSRNVGSDVFFESSGRLADFYVQRNQNDKARAVLLKTLPAADELVFSAHRTAFTDERAALNMYCRLGRLLAHEHQFNEADQILNKALSSIGDGNSLHYPARIKILILSELALSKKMQGNLVESFRLLKKCRELARNCGAEGTDRPTQNALIKMMIVCNDDPEIIGFTEDLINSGKLSKEEIWILKGFMVNSLIHTGQSKRASDMITEFDKSDIKSSQYDARSLADLFDRFAVACYDLKRYEDGIRNETTALAISRDAKLHDHMAQGWIEYNLGRLNLGANQLDKALVYFENAFKLFTESGPKIAALLSMTDILTAKHEYKKARDTLNEVLKLSPDSSIKASVMEKLRTCNINLLKQ